jgi:hypothetical protein
MYRRNCLLCQNQKKSISFISHVNISSFLNLKLSLLSWSNTLQISMTKIVLIYLVNTHPISTSIDLVAAAGFRPGE